MSVVTLRNLKERLDKAIEDYDPDKTVVLETDRGIGVINDALFQLPEPDLAVSLTVSIGWVGDLHQMFHLVHFVGPKPWIDEVAKECLAGSITRLGAQGHIGSLTGHLTRAERINMRALKGVGDEAIGSGSLPPVREDDGGQVHGTLAGEDETEGDPTQSPESG